MKTQKALVSFSKVKDTELGSIAQHIVNKTSNNPSFSNPIPPLATIQDAINVYTAAQVKCGDCTKEETAAKNAARLTLGANLSDLGNYVNLVAKGDVVKLDSTGFTLSKLPQSVGILDAPAFLNITYGNNPGEVIIEIFFVERASGYIVLYTPSPASEDNNEWYSKLFSKSKGTLTHLKRECKYDFKAAAVSAEANKWACTTSQIRSKNLYLDVGMIFNNQCD
jgi:hypothetical protein